MLFVIFLVILAVGIVWYLFDDWSTGAMFCIATGAIVLVCMLAILGVQYIGVNGYVAQMHERYDMLTYQYDNGFYENDNDVGKYELVSKIQDWNEDLRRRQTIQRDLWIGIFIPNIYDQFEYIPLLE